MTIGTSVHTRRDFVVVSALTFAGVGCVVALWPFVDQMNPSGSSVCDAIDVDLSQVQIGQVRWHPVLPIRHT